MNWWKYIALVVALYVGAASIEHWPLFERLMIGFVVGTLWFTYQTSKELDRTKERLYKLEALVKGFPE